MKTKTLKLTMTSLFAALICVATLIIRITTMGNGYIHLGDAFVVLSGILLGPVNGALAAGIGSAFADVFAGYIQYAVATFIIKALMAMISGLLYNKALHFIHKKVLKCIISSTIAGGLMIGGYLLFEIILYGFGAVASIPGNAVQAIASIIISSILVTPLEKVFKALYP